MHPSIIHCHFIYYYTQKLISMESIRQAKTSAGLSLTSPYKEYVYLNHYVNAIKD